MSINNIHNEQELIIDKNLVLHVARLAKISVKESEIDALETAMKNIVELITQVKNCEIKKIENNIDEYIDIEELREDVVSSESQLEHLKNHFTNFEHGYFKVPTFVDQE